MKKLSILLLLPLFSVAQNKPHKDDSCKVYRDVFIKLDTEDRKGEEPFLYRIGEKSLSRGRLIPGIGQASTMLSILQEHLERANNLYKEGKLWHFSDFGDEYKLIDNLRVECPTISLKGYEDEIAFYKSKYRKFDPVADTKYKRVGK